MKKLKKPSGITLVEVVIVIAISALLVLAAVRLNANRGRREFDNSMRELVAGLKNTQNAVQAGIGPDVTANCQTMTYTDVAADPDYLNGEQDCPYGVLLGVENIFARDDSDSAVTPSTLDDDRDYNMIDIGGGVLGARNYFQTKASFIVIPCAGCGSGVRPYGGTKKISMPSGVAYQGACYDGQAGCDIESGSGSGFTDGVNIIFAKTTQISPSSPSTNASNLVLSTFVKRCTMFFDPAWSSTTPPQGCNYSVGSMYLNNDPYTKTDITLKFASYDNKYKARINVKPLSNEINLEFE